MKVDINTLITRASRSRFNRWILNRILGRAIPFNSAHGIFVSRADERSVTVTLPYIRKNKNHLNGMHACALATLCEFAAGISLSRFFHPKKFRLIMKELSMQYQRQAKEPVSVVFNLPEQMVVETEKELENADATLITLISEAKDFSGNLVCTGTTTWQVKYWEKTHIRH